MLKCVYDLKHLSKITVKKTYLNLYMQNYEPACFYTKQHWQNILN